MQYTYDPHDNIYQLQTVKQGATTKESYTDDLVGNRLSSLGVSPYTYNSSNWLTSIPGTTYNYDNNGTLTSKSDGTAYSWDYENRLTQVVLPGSGGTVNFKYDPFGRRIQKAFTQGATTTTTNYVYDGANSIEEVDTNGVVVTRYTQGMGIDETLAELRSGTTSYYQADGLGSITSLSNPSGALANTYTYDSFGKLTASTGTIMNPFQYTARDYDSETGLRYYRARYYDQNVGRFISEDPADVRHGSNLYWYVSNHVATSRDPTGLTEVRGFDPVQTAQIQSAVNEVLNRLNHCCAGPNSANIAHYLASSVIVYNPDLAGSKCGLVTGLDFVLNHVELGPDAFNGLRCCDLEGIIAHEVVHLQWSHNGESEAYDAEEKCFGCVVPH